MPVILFAPGTVEPLANVAVKPRVDGQIVEVAFKEGDLVEEGSVLFRLDDRMVKAQIAPGRGQHRQGPGEPARCRGDAGAAPGADRQADRHRSRARSGALSPSRASRPASPPARRCSTRRRRSSTTSPSARRSAGRTGSLTRQARRRRCAAQDAPALVTINQTKPIPVSFAVPQGELAALRRALTAKATADINVPGGTQADRGAGRHRLRRQPGRPADRHHRAPRCVAENADEALWPGQSVEVALTVEVKPQHAVGAGRRRAAGAAGHDHLGDRAPTTRWRRAS